MVNMAFRMLEKWAKLWNRMYCTNMMANEYTRMAVNFAQERRGWEGIGLNWGGS